MTTSGFPLGCLFSKAHFFGLLAGSPIVGSPPPQKFPRYNLKPYSRGARRLKKEAVHSISVGGNFNKQENLFTRLDLDSHKMSSFPYPAAKS